jgi:hypothetical protein
MKICPEEAELFHADGRTDNDELMVAFCNSSNATSNPEIPWKLLFVFTPKFISEVTPNFENSCLQFGMKKRTIFLRF